MRCSVLHLCLSLALCHLSVAGASAADELPDTSRMNVLLLDFEDFSAASLGCYGNSICKSPNIDRLASTGVLFQRAYVQAVCCNPSRSSFLSGLRPETTNVHTNSDPMPERLPAGTKTLPTYFKERGFYLANIGKLFHGGFEGDHLRCFDRLEFSPKPAGWEGPGPILAFPPVRRRPGEAKAPKKDDPGYEQWRRARSDRYGDSGLTEEEEGDYRYSMTAVALLKEFAREKRQFFLSVGSQRPHTPLIAPKKYVDMYDPSQIPEPMAPRDQDRDVPEVARKFGKSSDIFMTKPATPQQAREAVAAYYACVSLVDAGVGRILDTFGAGRTGRQHDRRVPWRPRIPPGRTRVVVQVHALRTIAARAADRAGARRAGQRPERAQRLVEFVDILPTLGELVGAEPGRQP